MEVDGGATTITELPDLNPESIQIKPEFLDETDHVGFEDCKKEFGLENVPVSTELTNKETKHEGDWDMLEAEICEELIIKDEDEDISDINLALYSEDKTSKAGVLGANAYIDSLSAVSPKKEKIADQNAAGEDAATDHSCSLVITPFEEMVDAEKKIICQTATQKKRISFKCDQCDFSTTTRFAMARHQEQHSLHGAPAFRTSINTSKFKCQKCSYSSVLSANLTAHLKTHLKGAPIKQCHYCDYKSTNLNLSYHLKSYHFNSPKKVCLKNKCSYCYYRGTRQDLTYQIKCTHGMLEEHIHCKVCSYGTSEKKHERTHLKNVDIRQCPYCDYKSSSESPSCPLKCTQVKRNKKSPLVRIHRGIHYCKLCSYSTLLSSAFKTHESAHLDNDPVNCDYKSTRSSLINHLQRIHAKRKPMESSLKTKFYCRICSYNTTTLKGIEYHEKAHLNNYPIEQCPYCEYRSIKGALIYHMKSVHNLQTDRGVKKHIIIHEADDVSICRKNKVFKHVEHPYCIPLDALLCRYCGTFVGEDSYTINTHLTTFHGIDKGNVHKHVEHPYCIDVSEETPKNLQ